MDERGAIDVNKGIKRVVKAWNARLARHGWLKPEPALTEPQ